MSEEEEEALGDSNTATSAWPRPSGPAMTILSTAEPPPAPAPAPAPRSLLLRREDNADNVPLPVLCAEVYASCSCS